MKNNLALVLVFLVAISVNAQEISKKEQKFWEIFNTQNIELLEEFNKDGFIKNNFWFYKHPIIEAIKNKNYILVEYLLSSNIRNTLEIDDRKEKDIIEILVSEKFDEEALYLLNKRSEISNQLILSIIEKSQNIELLELLIKKIGNIDIYIGNYYDYTLLIYSIIKDNDSYIEYLVRNGCDIQKPYYTVKVGSLMYGEVVVALKSPLDLIMEKDKTKLIELFLKLNAKTVKQKLTDDIEYGKYLFKIFTEKKASKFYTSSPVELKEYPRDKSMKIIAIPQKKIVYIIDQTEKILNGDHYILWYLICTEDGNIGWVKNSQLYYPSYM